LKLFTSSCLKYFVNLAVEWITEFSFETEGQEGIKERRNKKTRNVHRTKHFWHFRVAIATDELSRTSVTVVVTVTVGAFCVISVSKVNMVVATLVTVITMPPK